MEDLMPEEECWITTYTGKKFYPFRPTKAMVDIFDIAHSLSLICRFNGHVSSFYSVADHSIRVSNLASSKNRLWGLLHDASEAYICDIARPLKKHSTMEFYSMVEKKIMDVVAEKFGIPTTMPEEIKNLDHKLLLTEKRDLLPRAHPDWITEETNLNTIVPLSPELAEKAFLDLFFKLVRQ